MNGSRRKIINYTDTIYKALMSEYKSLSTFREVTAWDKRAWEEVEKIDRVISELETEIDQCASEIKRAEQEHKEKSFLSRMFDSRKTEKELLAIITEDQKYMDTLVIMASEMQEVIDFTPDAPDEQRALIKELRLRKKELLLEKREVAANIKAIRTAARQEDAKISGRFFYNSKTAAADRRKIRYQKESALRPQEDAQAALDRQLFQVERDITWAERFRE